MTSCNPVAVAKISAERDLGQMLTKEVLGRGVNSGKQVCAKFYPTLCFFWVFYANYCHFYANLSHFFAIIRCVALILGVFIHFFLLQIVQRTKIALHYVLRAALE